MKVSILGATGFVGRRLVDHFLERGFEVVSIARSKSPGSDHSSAFKHISADTTSPGSWQSEVSAADVVINLAGQTIFHYWTAAYKQKIYSSRILTTRNLVASFSKGGPKLLLNASAVGYYGNRDDEVLTEEQPAGTDFLAKVASDWEKEALAAAGYGVRVVAMRFGVILGPDGGALASMVPAFKFFLGGPLGSGKQWMSWMHLEDLVRAVDFIVSGQELEGPLNFCSPNPLVQRDFAKALGRTLGRPAVLPLPATVVKLMMGDLGRTLLGGQRAFPRKLLENGFKFDYPDIDQALAEILSRR